MLVCSGALFFVALVSGYASAYPVLLGIVIVIFCFLFSIIAVYGSRAISIGVAALLVMVLNIDRHYEGQDLILHAFYILTGGLWYTALSLLLYSFRPYKLLQQSLGECIMTTADYLRIRSEFYGSDVNYEKIYSHMMEQQVMVHQNQELVRELLFKSRNIVKESTLTGRTLLMLFVDVVDLFERTMTSYQDYEKLHSLFRGTGILQRYQQRIKEIAAALDDVGIAVKSGKPAEQNDTLLLLLDQEEEYLDQFRDQFRTAENIEGFISLRNILKSMEDIVQRVHSLRLYTTYDKKLVTEPGMPVDYERFVSHQDYRFKLLSDHLSLRSNIFRHALRVSIATLAGYLISWLLPFGHSYWILLTIIVILKPAYSLTKQRNSQRLLGTIGGAGLGFLILYFVKNNTALFVVMMFLMIGTYSFLRTRYMLAVVLMTPYILLLFHLLFKTDFEAIVLDRILDTVIGSVIALLANTYILPVWEHQKMQDYMVDMLEKNAAYFKTIAAAFVGRPAARTDYKVSRKNAFVSLANLSDALSRMLSEPRRKQKNGRQLHQFVALNHMLTSHIAALSQYAATLALRYQSGDFALVCDRVSLMLQAAIDELKAGIHIRKQPVENTLPVVTPLDRQVTALLKQRQQEIRAGLTETTTRKKLSELKSVTDQFTFIVTVAADIRKVSEQITQSVP